MSKTFDEVPFERKETNRTRLLAGDLLTNRKDCRATFGKMALAGDSQLVMCALPQEQRPEEARLMQAATDAERAKNYREAEKAFKKLLEFQEKEYGKDSPQLARTYISLGAACEHDRRWADAQNYYKKQAEVSKVAYKAEGPENAMVAFATANIARMDARQGHLEDAAKNYKEAIRMFEKGKPETFPDSALSGVIRTYDDYGHVLAVQGETTASDIAFDKAAALAENLKARRKKNPNPGREI